MNVAEVALAFIQRPTRFGWSAIQTRLAVGAAWSVAGALLARSMGLIASIVVARMLGKEGFGEFGVVQSTIGMFATFAGFAMGLTATKYVAELQHTAPGRVRRILALSSLVSLVTGGVMAGVLALGASWIARHTLAAPHLDYLLRMGAVLLLLGAVNGAYTGALTGFEDFKRIAQINFVTGIATLPLMVLGTWRFGVKGAVGALILTQGLSLWLTHRAVQDRVRTLGGAAEWRDCLKEVDLLWRFSLPALLGGIMVGPVTWATTALLVNQPGGYAEMGVFNAANQWRTLVAFLPSQLATVGLPVLAHFRGLRQRSEFVSVFRSYAAMVVVASLLVALPVILLSRPLMNLYGAEFGVGHWVLVLLVVAAVLTCTVSTVGQVIASMDQMWVGFMLNAIWAIALFGLTWKFVYLGAFGLALATVLAYGVHFFTVSFWTVVAVKRDRGLL